MTCVCLKRGCEVEDCCWLPMGFIMLDLDLEASKAAAFARALALSIRFCSAICFS